MNKVKITTIIPTYNKAKYIKRCLDSILIQSLKDTEIICVDNGSTDKTIDIISEYVKRNKQVILLHEEQKGAGVCRNKGLAYATGEYVHFLDGDDFLEPDAYKTMYDNAIKYDCDVIKVRANYLGNSIKEKLYYESYRFPFWLYNKRINIDNNAEVLCSVPPVCWNGLYKRCFLEDRKIMFNNLLCVNDRSFNVDVIVNANSIVYINRKLVNCQASNGISTIDTRSKHFNCLLESIKIIRDICNKRNVNNVFKKIIMKHEYRDAKIWYKRCEKNNLCNDDIRKIMNEIKKEITN